MTWGNGAGGTVGTISAVNSLVGSSTNDAVGLKPTSTLTNGNYVVVSPLWDNGTVIDAGAVTWGNGTGGTVGIVSVANSLVGSTSNDNVGDRGIAVLNDNNYVVSSPYWDNGAIADAGAVTWGNGTGGTVGTVSAANSLVGGATGEGLGTVVTPLAKGNYVVVNHRWNGFRGAVTWGNGSGGTVGEINASNSLVGSTIVDELGRSSTFALPNGNYVVCSPNWDNGTITNAGAVTWGSGTGGTVGPVSATNSLVGSMSNDNVGMFRIAYLTNGHYVVSSPNWNGRRGAVTWCNGSGGTVGEINASNSLVGNNIDEGPGLAVPLTNGNYVALGSTWNGGRGAATWGNGAGGTVGLVSATNSLVGSSAGDFLGSNQFSIGVTALPNGNYVVVSPRWDGGRGAVTWCSGTGGTVGPVSAANSLVGSSANDLIGEGLLFGGGITVLSNGNYVVRSPDWNSTRGGNLGQRCWWHGGHCQWSQLAGGQHRRRPDMERHSSQRQLCGQ